MKIRTFDTYFLLFVFLICIMAGCTFLPESLPTATQVPLMTNSPAPTPLATFGIIKGKVTVGPLTPVERVDQPTPTPAPAVFTSRAINILDDETQVVIKKVFFKADGTYQVELPPGRYRLELVKNGMDRAKNLPKVILLERGQAIVFDVEIDTGIR